MDEARSILQAAKNLGLNLRFHADQLTLCGGADLAVELGAASAIIWSKSMTRRLKKTEIVRRHASTFAGIRLSPWLNKISACKKDDRLRTACRARDGLQSGIVADAKHADDSLDSLYTNADDSSRDNYCRDNKRRAQSWPGVFDRQHRTRETSRSGDFRLRRLSTNTLFLWRESRSHCC